MNGRSPEVADMTVRQSVNVCVFQEASFKGGETRMTIRKGRNYTRVSKEFSRGGLGMY